MTFHRFLADIRGRLQSEEIVGKDIHDPLELCQRHESQDHWIRSDIPDWKQLVRETLSPLNVNMSVRIRVVQPVVTEAQVRRELSTS